MSENLQIAILSSAATLLVGWGSIYIAHRLQQSRDMRLRDRQGRQQTLASLMGQRLLIAQLHVSRFEALIFSVYHEARWKLAGQSGTSLDLREAMRWMQKSEELALEFARTSQKLFETIGLAKVLFTPSEKLGQLTDAFFRHRVPTVEDLPTPG